MKSKIEIFSEVMLSLRGDQSVIMDNINTLLDNRDKELNVVPRIKEMIKELALTHIEMQECESFILQLTQSNLEKETTTQYESESNVSENVSQDNNTPGQIGSSGDFNNSQPSEK